MALLVYIDDIIIAGSNLHSIQALQDFLTAQFKLKSLRDLKYFLDIEVAHSAHGIHISQHKYRLDILADLGSLGFRPVKLPMEQTFHLVKILVFLFPTELNIDIYLNSYCILQ